ncbi:hypothetical protein ACEN4P_11115 [Marinilactibacillus psychrotolerans]|uniref:Uncharacterized protein n=2 Tax=Marinilactibacillus psychrotolerans TaxID=191770 RepID=A0A5R9BWY2_9LACT|nr:hypothetical protein [Marinilactibacillus psychrotolerans]TLQ05216.1 hypothetical protein FEZ48_12655 [Marinilactibacillus psychrotolerans]SJN44836.1 hypothetical protein FM115_10815 [Marinilactibacillus psychrotolerans 42ea]
MNKIKKSLLLASLLVILTPLTTVSARTVNDSYNYTLPGFNGTVTTSIQTQKKTYSGSNGLIEVRKSTNKQKYDARMLDEKGRAGSWVRQVPLNSARDLPANIRHYGGLYSKLQLSSNWNATKNQTSGIWRSN